MNKSSLVVKKIIRRFSLWLKFKTDKWIVEKEVWEMIDKDEWDKASALIQKQEKIWPDDPEIVYANSIIENFK